MDTNQTSGVPVAIEYRDGKEVVDARSLHQALEVGRDFSNWIKGRIEEYGFIQGKDYEVFAKTGENPSGGRPATEYALTLDMAKELALVEKNEKGKAIRQYFIAVEKASRELAAKFAALGGANQVVSYALMGRVYQIFANTRDVGLKQIFHIMELALAKSALTDDYIMAKDIALAMRASGGADGYSMGESTIETKVTKIRELVEEFGFIPKMVRLGNGDYKAAPDVRPERPGFPLRLPAKAAAND